MHALALKDKEEEHAGLLHTASEIQVHSSINCIYLQFSAQSEKRFSRSSPVDEFCKFSLFRGLTQSGEHRY